jgi:HEAT repeats
LIVFGIDLTLTLARWLAWGTLGLVALMVLFLLVLRWVRSYRAPRLASFESQWLPRLMACALGDEVVPIPLARWQRWHFMKLWLRAQMSLQGVSRKRLATFGRAMGCSSMALQRAHSPHQSERMVGMLALGFLGEVQYVPLLLKRLVSERAQQSVYAGRALLEIDEQAHADKVVQALLTTPGLEMSLTSIVFRPFRARMADVLLRKPPHPSEAESLRWLRLARALQSQIPTVVLIPFLQQDEDIECLIAAIRLVQGEQGGALVAAQAQHKDWRVRGQVARALGFIGGSEELHVLRQLLTDETWWVRYRAAQSLLQLPAMNAERLLEIAHITQDRYALSMAQAVIAEVGGCA